MVRRLNCSVCFLDRPAHRIKRIKKKWICSECYRKQKYEHRVLLKKEAGFLSREERMKVWAEKREQKELLRKELPVIQGIKIKGQKVKYISKQFHGYLTYVERQILYKKYRATGMAHEDVIKKVQKTAEHLSELVKKMREEKKSEEHINVNFKEEFAKLIQSS